jgi:hypothetical protein
MIAILIRKDEKEILIGELLDVLTEYVQTKHKRNIELYKNLNLIEANRLVQILEPYYEANSIHIVPRKII